MKRQGIWGELIKPTLLAYLLACTIPAIIAISYYVYNVYF
jgi:hypothetical protein